MASLRCAINPLTSSATRIQPNYVLYSPANTRVLCHVKLDIDHVYSSMEDRGSPSSKNGNKLFRAVTVKLGSEF